MKKYILNILITVIVASATPLICSFFNCYERIEKAIGKEGIWILTACIIAFIPFLGILLYTLLYIRKSHTK